jgi:hypothetical protein
MAETDVPSVYFPMTMSAAYFYDDLEDSEHFIGNNPGGLSRPIYAPHVSSLQDALH